MPENVIVGVDGREGGRDAVALARVLAPDARLLLVHAFPIDAEWTAYADPGFGDELRAAALRVVGETRDGEAPNADVEAVPDGSPARALQRLAEERAADLLVAGTPHRGTVGRVLLGNVARDLLQGAPCPVAIAARERRVERIERIGVGYDGSPEAERALAFAAELAARPGGRLTLLAVAQPLSAALAAYAYEYDAAGMDEAERERCRRLVEEARARLDPSLVADAEVLYGWPAQALVERSEQLDLLVVGSRGWGAVRRVIAGSTSIRLANEAACGLIVVPRSESGPDS